MKIPPIHTCTVLPSYSHTCKRRGLGAQRRFCGSTVLHVVYAARDPVEEHRGAHCQFSIFTSGGRGPAQNTKGRHGMRLGCMFEAPKISHSVQVSFLSEEMFRSPHILQKERSQSWPGLSVPVGLLMLL